MLTDDLVFSATTCALLCALVHYLPAFQQEEYGADSLLLPKPPITNYRRLRICSVTTVRVAEILGSRSTVLGFAHCRKIIPQPD
jgi:hypothetical protein